LLISHKVTNFQSNFSLSPAYKIILSDILHPNTDVGYIEYVLDKQKCLDDSHIWTVKTPTTNHRRRWFIL